VISPVCALVLHATGAVRPTPRALVIEAGAAAPSPVPAALAVVTFNVWGLPEWVHDAPRERYARVRAELERTSPDLVLLQEVWSDQAREVIPSGWTVARSTRSLWPFAHNGLVTLSRHPIEGGEFRAFSAASFPGSIATKGALKTTVRLPGGERVNVWNVHLQAGASSDVRARQIDELVHWVRTARDGQVADLVGGDFNCTPDGANFARLTARLGRPVHELSGVAYFPTWDARGARPSSTLAFDHVFVRAAPGVVEVTGPPHAVFGAERPEERCSDHLGVQVELRLARPARTALAAR